MLTSVQVAALFGVHRQTPIAWAKQGILPSCVGKGRVYYYDEVDVFSLIVSRHVASPVTDQWGAWFSGLCDGEGSFIISRPTRNGHNRVLTFTIGLRLDDLPLLENVLSTLGVGHIYLQSEWRNREGYSSAPRAQYMVCGIPGCMVIAETLTKYPLRSKKARDFQIWKRALDLKRDLKWKKKYDRAAFSALYDELKETRKYREPDGIGNYKMYGLKGANGK